MKKFFNNLGKDRIGIWSFWISIIAILTCLILIGAFYRQLPLYVPLYNQLPWGYARLGTRLEFLIPVGIVVVWSIVNFSLAFSLREKAILMSRFLFVTNMAIAVFLGIFVIKVLQLIL